MAFTADGKSCIAGVVLWDMKARATIESHVAVRKVRFPYVPGLLSFREAPAVLSCLRKLQRTPDVIICDGHGLAHPRRFGIACHIGVIVDLPTIGCAKSRLIGTHCRLGNRKGATTALTDRSQTIASVVRSRDDVRPVFVSVGHLIQLRAAVRIVLACTTRYRLPEPTRLADQLVAREKRRLAKP